jgi:hypothetical protein
MEIEPARLQEQQPPPALFPAQEHELPALVPVVESSYAFEKPRPAPPPLGNYMVEATDEQYETARISKRLAIAMDNWIVILIFGLLLLFGSWMLFRASLLTEALLL